MIKYSYDNISQLIREENEVTGEVIDYSYDTGGNILSKTVTKNGVSKVYSYDYGDANWKDKLTAFDGQTISYDAIGNPLSMGTKGFTWEQGRKLASFTDTAKGIGANYKYDENGIRKSKYVVESNKSVTKEYITSNGEVVAEKVTTNLYNSDNELTGTSTEVVSYTRGADGKLVSMTKTDMSTNNSTTYYYITNIQGDVEAIVDSDGNEVVRYSYDAYGRVTGITGSLKDSLGEMNPFRYRSYYFDSESGFYYLQSRYYSPLMGRFINGDDRLVDNGNMFAYCGNNPVINVDYRGTDYSCGWSDENYVPPLDYVEDPVGYEYMDDDFYGPPTGFEYTDEDFTGPQGFEYSDNDVGGGNVIVPKDITKDLDDLMKNNANYLKSIPYVYAVLKFGNNVRTGHEWDLKNAEFGDSIYIYKGEYVYGTDIGNIHFGYVGKAIFSEPILLQGAGAYQIISGTSSIDYLLHGLGDDPNDQRRIKEGIYYYKFDNALW